jgi:hypothetical protein
MSDVGGVCVDMAFWNIAVIDNAQEVPLVFMSSDANYDDLFRDALTAIERHTTLCNYCEEQEYGIVRTQRRKEYRNKFARAKRKLIDGGSIVNEEFEISLSVQKVQARVTTIDETSINLAMTTGEFYRIEDEESHTPVASPSTPSRTNRALSP